MKHSINNEIFNAIESVEVGSCPKSTPFPILLQRWSATHVGFFQIPVVSHVAYSAVAKLIGGPTNKEPEI